MDCLRKRTIIFVFLCLLSKFEESSGEHVVPKQLIAGCPFQVLEPPSVRVFITVSSLVQLNEPILQRQLELNWFNVNPIEGDWVGLFSSDPRLNWTEPLDEAVVVDHPAGWYRTSVSLPYYHFGDPTLPDPGNDTSLNDTEEQFPMTTRCLDYWVAYFRSGVVIASQCFAVRPDWMWESRQTIGEFALHELLIPGTHNAGSYKENKGRKSDDVVARYKICQEENIWNQLMYGIRHFDFRIGFYKSNPIERFWFNHEFVRINPISRSIAQVKAFVNATKEIVILDFHRFPVGFKNRAERHRKLIMYLRRELGEYMIPRSYGYEVKLNRLWETNKRILVTYSNEFYTMNDLLWNGLSQVWASTNKGTQLKQYFDNYIAHSVPPLSLLWSAMAELTPTVWDVLSNPNGSLRKFADKVNRNVTQWFRDEWWNRANIVATDYFLGNNMVEVAIESNRRRKLCRDLVFSRISHGESQTTTSHP